MKLIDLLVRELPKRGGWPDGMSCACQSRVDSEIYFYKKLYHYSHITKGLCDFSIYLDDCGKSEGNHDGYIYVTSDQYQSALAASQKVEWSGDGLPPVGVKCEIIINEGNLGLCEIIFVGQSLLVWRQDSTYQEGSGYHRHMKFRPLRSEEDKKRDAVAGKIFDVICKSLTDNSESTSFAIYDAIAAGKIPGVKLGD